MAQNGQEEVVAHARSLLLEIDPSQGSESRLRQLDGLAELVVQWGSRINLTGYRDREGVYGGLILDALEAFSTALGVLGGLPPRVVDLGSGAGFPGLPIAIAAPRTQVVLVEARQRRHHFQKAACRDLGVGNALPRRGRAEAVEAEPADCVFAQAVGPLPAVIDLGQRWVEPGGWLVVPTGSILETPVAPSGWSSSLVRHYGPDRPTGRRSLWLGCRSSALRDSP